MSDRNVSAAEIARFDALATRWWDPDGPMRALHAMNGPRLAWIASQLRQAGRTPGRLLDVGCGAGLAAEGLARAGHEVLGIDAAPEVIAAARDHAAGLEGLCYRVADVQDLGAEGLRFPVITALEVIEHVPDPGAFLRQLAALLEPGGMLFVSTINRTMRSWLFAKVGAEYLMRMLPIGTHEWRSFITPAELAQKGRQAGLRFAATTGLGLDIVRQHWRTTEDVAINYMAELIAA